MNAKEKERIDEKRRIAYEKEKEPIINECLCGIIKTNICSCQYPKYELIKLHLHFHLYCIMCNKWKCRCNF